MMLVVMVMMLVMLVMLVMMLLEVMLVMMVMMLVVMVMTVVMLVSSVLMIIVMMTLPSCTESQSSQMLFCTISFNVKQPNEVGFLCPVYGRCGLRDGCLGFLN